MINKGTISSFEEAPKDRNDDYIFARVLPLTSDSMPTRPLVISWHLRGKMGNLKVGDIVMKEGHVWMYAGDGYLVEASGGNFSAESIAMKKVAKSRYAKYKTYSSGYVVRYKG